MITKLYAKDLTIPHLNRADLTCAEANGKLPLFSP